MILQGLINLAKRIGRWLVDRLTRFLASHVAGYMLGKVEDFKRRLVKAKTARRKRWLRGRIRRWTAAAAWLTRNNAAITTKVVREYSNAVAHLPAVAPGDRYTRAA